MATGTLVSAGTLTTTTASTIGRTGYAIKFNNVTLTGTGVVYLRTRIEANDAVKMKNQDCSFQAVVYHDVGSAKNYTIYINKADSANDFSAVTAIDNSGAISVSSATETQIKFEDVAMGDCSTGVEIEIKVECGAITTKDFEFTEMQLEVGAVITSYEHRQYELELALCQRYVTETANVLSLTTFGQWESPYQDYAISTQTRYYTLSNGDFSPFADTGLIFRDGSNGFLCSSSATVRADVIAGIHLPHGATVTSFKVYWYRDDASASGTCNLYRATNTDGTGAAMAGAPSDATTGNHSVEDTTISNAVIDNVNYNYWVYALLDPNNAEGDVLLRAVVITYTITTLLP